MNASSRPKVGLALGSGGARGWCHIGALRELDRIGIRPSVVTGCSMGAVVGAALAGGRLDALEDWARSLTATSVLGYIDMRLSGGGIVEGQEVAHLLADLELPDRIEDLDLPFATVATDLATGEEVWFTQGDLATAVRASLSLPGVFSPYPHRDRWLLDGALCNPVPVSLATHVGAERVIAIDPNATGGRPIWTSQVPQTDSQTLMARIARSEMLPSRLRDWITTDATPEDPLPRPPTYLEVLNTTLEIMQIKILEERLRTDPPDVFLEADLKHVGILELNRAAEAIDHGRELVRGQQDALSALAAPQGA